MNSFFYDIFYSNAAGKDMYEGTIRFHNPDITYEQMLVEASKLKNFPMLPYRDNVRFVLQGTSEWQRIIDNIKAS